MGDGKKYEEGYKEFSERLLRKAVMEMVEKRALQEFAKLKGIFKLEFIALEIGIPSSDLLQILADLRDEGKINYKYNSDTGEIEFGR
ncbi:MAG: hypothetical protein ACFFD2_10230 [Promethearchaeota archaeon]